MGRVDGNAEFAPEGGQLVDRGGPVDVGGHQVRPATALVAQVPREFRRRRRLAGALQSDEQEDDRRRGSEIERNRGLAHDARELGMDELHQVLLGREALQHLFAERMLAHAADERLNHRERDVGLEKRHADLPQRLVDVALGDLSVAAEPLEDLLELVA